MTTVQTDSSTSRPIKWYHLWPVLMGPAALAAVVVLSKLRGGPETYDQWSLDADLEALAPWLALATAGVYWIRTIATRNPLYMILMILTGTLLLRELHWDPAIKDAAIPMVAVCLVWALIWWDLLRRPLADRKHTVWVVAAVVTFALGQIIDRRALKFLPDEGVIHSKYEESVEVAGHTAMLIAAMVGSWLHYGPGGKVISIREAFWPSPCGRFLGFVLRRKPQPTDGRDDQR